MKILRIDHIGIAIVVVTASRSAEWQAGDEGAIVATAAALSHLAPGARGWHLLEQARHRTDGGAA